MWIKMKLRVFTQNLITIMFFLIGYHTNYLEVYQHPTRGVWITSENGGADIVEQSKGKKGKKEVEDFKSVITKIG